MPIMLRVKSRVYVCDKTILCFSSLSMPARKTNVLLLVKDYFLDSVQTHVPKLYAKQVLYFCMVSVWHFLKSRYICQVL